MIEPLLGFLEIVHAAAASLFGARDAWPPRRGTLLQARRALAIPGIIGARDNDPAFLATIPAGAPLRVVSDAPPEALDVDAAADPAYFDRIVPPEHRPSALALGYVCRISRADLAAFAAPGPAEGSHT